MVNFSNTTNLNYFSHAAIGACWPDAGVLLPDLVGGSPPCFDLHQALLTTACGLSFLRRQESLFLTAFCLFRSFCAALAASRSTTHSAMAASKSAHVTVWPPAAMISAWRDAIASLPCVRSRAARNTARRDAITSLPVTVHHGAMDDAWRELWDGGAGQPYSAVVFKSSTTNDNRNLASLTILLVHYRTRFISIASGNSVR